MSAMSRSGQPSVAAQLWGFIARNDVFFILLVIGAVAALISPAFLSARNLSNLLTQSALLGILSVGQFLVVVSGGFDLSVAAVMALSSLVLASNVAHGLGPAALLAVAVGLGCGVFNGIVVTLGRVVPLIATLAMMGIARGLAFSISERSKGDRFLDADPPPPTAG